MVIQKEVEGTYFDSAFQTGSASLMTLNQYIGKVKSGEYARPIAYLRGLIKAGKKDEADAYKKKLPLYVAGGVMEGCLLYTSPSPRDGLLSRMPSSA